MAMSHALLEENGNDIVPFRDLHFELLGCFFLQSWKKPICSVTPLFFYT